MNEMIRSKDAEVINQHTGERWVYSDIVKDHFFHPRNLLLEGAKEGEFDAEGMVGSPACLAPETIVVKKDGVAPIRDIGKGEVVLTEQGVYHPVERVFRPRSEKLIVTMKTQLGTLTCTEDHLIKAISIERKGLYPFVRTSKKRTLPPMWHHAADLKRGDVLLYPRVRLVEDIVEAPLPHRERKAWDFRSKSLGSKVPLNSETLELFGYFIAEGHTKSDDKEVGFTFGDMEDHLAERVSSLISKYFGLRSHIKKKHAHHRIDVLVYNVQLAHAFRTWFGTHAAEKRIPEGWMLLPLEKQEGLLRGVWRGDGYVSKGRRQSRAGFATVSKTLSRQMQFLLIRHGIIPSLYCEPSRITKGVRHRPAFRTHVGDRESLERLCGVLEIHTPPAAGEKIVCECWVDDNFVYVPMRSVIPAGKSSVRLYNFEIAVSHTYATDAFLVHNCGDVMYMWIKVDRDSDRIRDLKWKTFGCGSAIASTSMFSVMVTENDGMKIDDALKVRPQDVMVRLGGLPNRKIHCSVLADKAFRKAVNEYFRVSGQNQRIIVEGAKVVDKRLNITDKDIEEAVLEGAQTLEEVQHKLKVGVGDPEALPEIEQLIRFYKEKYYG